MWRFLRITGSFLLVDKAIKRVKSLVDDEPSLDYALEQYQYHVKKCDKYEQIIARKGLELQSIIRKAKSISIKEKNDGYK